MRHLIFLVALILSSNSIIGQELKLNVQVSAPQIKTVDPKVFKTLEQEISNFMNNTKWTDDEFEQDEKIEGNLNITITNEFSPTSFSADIFLQAIRPVFNSNYKSQTINFADKGIRIQYREFQPIQNSYNTYIDQLSSVLTYYAYLLIGYDYDSYSPSGGDPHFKTAQNVISAVPQTPGTGWDSNSKDRVTRFRIIDELLDPRTRPYRQAIYEYHIKSLDRMTEDAGKSRAVMMSAITSVNQVHSSLLNSAVIQLFCDSKRKEIVEIFKGAGSGDKSKVLEIMIKMDPSRAGDYSAIK